MAFQYIEAINNEKIKNPVSVFLAGGISGCEDWQEKVTDLLRDCEELTVVNPRRKDFDVSKMGETVKQIKWEYKRLREVDIILFWFTDDTVQPITLYELGSTLQRIYGKQDDDRLPVDEQQVVFIGCDPEYMRKFDVKIQAKLIGYGRTIFPTLEQTVDTVKKYYRLMVKKYK